MLYPLLVGFERENPGDVGVKNTIMQFLLHFYRRIICSPPIDLVPTEIVLPNTQKQGDGKTI